MAIPLLLVIPLLLAEPFSAHECIHSQISKQVMSKMDLNALNAKKAELMNSPARLLQSQQVWRPISIVVDYSNFLVNNNTIVNYTKAVFNDHLLPRLQSMIKVKGSTVIPPFQSTPCDNFFKVPDKYKTQATTADLIIFVVSLQESSRYLAYSSECTVSESDLRPNTGFIAINMSNQRFGQARVEPFLNTLLHESLHILIMSPSLFAMFPQDAS